MHTFLPYGKQWIDEDDIQSVAKVLKGDYITQGPRVEAFERDICAYTGATYCVVVSHGTAALHISVAALNLNENVEGITSPITFVASANCMVYSKIKPLFVDIDKRTYLINIDALRAKINERVKLIIPVHLAGHPVDMEKIHQIVKKDTVYIIEDAAHALGSRYKDGSRVGNCHYSDMTVFSFHPVKPITTGEGGAITTNNRDLYQKLVQLRNHGITKDPAQIRQNPGPWYYEMQCLGYNYRMTDIQASLGISQMGKLDRFISRRREIAAMYNKAFKNSTWLTTPYEDPLISSGYHLYILLFDLHHLNMSKKEVMLYLKERGVGTQVHYIPIHTQPYYQTYYGYQWGDFPNAEYYYQSALSIPIYPKMTDEEVAHVIHTIQSIENA
jgi:UDP-4-amino-4,6-dideoxy-N-acetyl-beta-L-altrosamine transaminase